MATTTILRPDTSGVHELPTQPSGGDDHLAAFRAGRAPEDRLIDLVAFAMATEARLPPTAAMVERTRHEASTALSDHAFRYLHNSIEEIRRTAVAEHATQAPRGPGFGRLVLANLVALAAAAGLVVGWLSLYPATLTGLAGLLAG